MQDKDIERVLSSDGVLVAHHTFGGKRSRASTPISIGLFAHGTGLCSHLWAPVVERLADLVAVAVDQRPHGYTQAPEGVPLGAVERVADLLAVIDDQGLTDLVGVGHSVGAASLLRVELERPGTFRGIWAYEPILHAGMLDVNGPGEPGLSPLAEGARRRREVFDSAEEARRRFASRPPFGLLDSSVLDAYVEHGLVGQPDGTVSLRCPAEREAQCYEQWANDAFEQLGLITCPVTICHGTAEPERFHDFGPSVAAQIPGAHLEAFEGKGHFGPFQDLAITVASIERLRSRL